MDCFQVAFTVISISMAFIVTQLLFIICEIARSFRAGRESIIIQNITIGKFDWSMRSSVYHLCSSFVPRLLLG